ncbi:hypothetical protein [Burkholderia ubonensis]|uniref:hypothetical protein n=1 Tax=Burkholderia ubonensis TaxID=101571 RepID=UPI000756886C|nr:hypothetical protein [Burkholderia ubonensis]KVS39948.1 hypothetical protein WK38_03450 [Burkholderia ubonensis]KVS48044.1 hypothetical protein WK37_08380 [Burkholderia ubonensis]KVS78777.1 hypothetical protein WK42_16110 [Burkholderia ubonensis]KVS93422.1 hypothetical protein WK44_11035 [Burkholderia ubonensis]KVS94167.1 hypothetical protein WK43_09535 [Burkholderia ubonensis]
MGNQVIIDIDKVEQAAKALKANPAAAASLISDPKAFLAAQGVEISDRIDAVIRSKRITTAGAPRQAAIIHIDA